MIKKLNPVKWYTRVLDAFDAWTERMSYQGSHWATA